MPPHAVATIRRHQHVECSPDLNDASARFPLNLSFVAMDGACRDESSTQKRMALS